MTEKSLWPFGSLLYSAKPMQEENLKGPRFYFEGLLCLAPAGPFASRQELVVVITRFYLKFFDLHQRPTTAPIASAGMMVAEVHR